MTDAGFDPERAWGLHPQVSVRPERFGALMYHFGTRRLSFLKSPKLLEVVSALDSHPSALEACAAAEVPPEQMPSYTNALTALANTMMIRPR
ncbi:mycofactocin biosynthesis chaperone MftB [Nocardia sp. NPDC059239]|uniref:mycofactocin biosynthesis chaperone MftB n=1 Tax=unclassified Nocardia TaxID=2637762 RepID=UPI0036ACA0B7